MDKNQEQILSFLSTFTTRVYSELYCPRTEKLGNLLVSPTCIWMAISMTEAGSRGRTREEMISELGLPSKMGNEKMHELVANTVTKCFESAEGVDISLANRLFVLRAARIEEQFRELLQKCYKSDSEQLDSGSVDVKRDRMNIWVSEKTKGKIKQILAPGSINEESVITIINAIYFRGGWQEVFAKEETSDAPFYKHDGSEQTVKMMWNETVYPYVRLPDISAQALRIPFRNKNWEMLVILPDRYNGLPKVVEYLRGQGAIDMILRTQFKDEDVILSLPRFKLGEKLVYDVTDKLYFYYMRLVFEKQSADLSGICKNQRLVLSKVLHNAVLEVDEEGAMTAATTDLPVKISRRIPTEPIAFRVDHPFFVSIVYGGKIPVLVGHFTLPETFQTRTKQSL